MSDFRFKLNFNHKRFRFFNLKSNNHGSPFPNNKQTIANAFRLKRLRFNELKASDSDFNNYQKTPFFNILGKFCHMKLNKALVWQNIVFPSRAHCPRILKMYRNEILKMRSLYLQYSTSRIYIFFKVIRLLTSCFDHDSTTKILVDTFKTVCYTSKKEFIPNKKIIFSFSTKFLI